MEHLDTYLKKNGLTRAAFADLLNVSKGYVTELLNGSKTPSLSLAVEIERATRGAVPPSAWIRGAKWVAAE